MMSQFKRWPIGDIAQEYFKHIAVQIVLHVMPDDFSMFLLGVESKVLHRRKNHFVDQAYERLIVRGVSGALLGGTRLRFSILLLDLFKPCIQSLKLILNHHYSPRRHDVIRAAKLL